jgi:7,8-dihydroneopterin aldolase/epimerase/oxygenase
VTNSVRITEQVFIRNYHTVASVGAWPDEKNRRQPLVFNVRVEIDRGAQLDDEITETLGYHLIADMIESVLSSGHIHLLETVGRRIAALVLEDPRAQLVELKIEKPGIVAGADGAGAIVIARRD